VAGKLIERRIDGREAQTLFFPFCFLIDKARAGMQMLQFNQHVDDSQSLRGNFQPLFFELFDYRLFADLTQSGIIPDQ